MAIVKQIKNLVNDAVKDAIGNEQFSTLDTTDLLSMGKALSQLDMYEAFYGKLANRIIKTVYFVRVYKGKTREVLRDEHTYGAFIQKVYVDMPEAVDNPTWDETAVAGSYHQHSPYDVDTTIGISTIMLGGTQGTWSQEFVMQRDKLVTAFTSESAMMALIDYIYVQAENRIKLELEHIEGVAVNTSIANCLANGKARNLLLEYNEKHPTNQLTVSECMEDLDFLKYATTEIKLTIGYMGNMTKNYNIDEYLTFTPTENLVVEMLDKFATATSVYLQADTYHKELVALPGYNKITYWQNPGKAFAFTDISKIKVKHNQINSGEVVEQGGIICFLHDTENIACYFGDRYTWEEINKRDKTYIHGEQFRKGYAIDSHANSFVFYIAEE